jgi:hypothetical protein
MDANRYTMETVEAAYAVMEERTAKGKVVIETSGEVLKQNANY